MKRVLHSAFALESFNSASFYKENICVNFNVISISENRFGAAKFLKLFLNVVFPTRIGKLHYAFKNIFYINSVGYRETS